MRDEADIEVVERLRDENDTILIAFGKYISGYRPNSEGWTDKDDWAYQQALQGAKS